MAIAALAISVLGLPQLHIVVWETRQAQNIYFWGGHTALQASVSVVAYLLAVTWALVAAGFLGLAYYRLLRSDRRAIAGLNWGAFFIAVELAFLLGIGEEILSDLRGQGFHADSYASWGGGISLGLLIALLFVPGWVKRAYFSPKKREQVTGPSDPS